VLRALEAERRNGYGRRPAAPTTSTLTGAGKGPGMSADPASTDTPIHEDPSRVQ
jgi:hypothetical protein